MDDNCYMLVTVLTTIYQQHPLPSNFCNQSSKKVINFKSPTSLSADISTKIIDRKKYGFAVKKKLEAAIDYSIFLGSLRRQAIPFYEYFYDDLHPRKAKAAHISASGVIIDEK